MQINRCEPCWSLYTGVHAAIIRLYILDSFPCVLPTRDASREGEEETRQQNEPCHSCIVCSLFCYIALLYFTLSDEQSSLNDNYLLVTWLKRWNVSKERNLLLWPRLFCVFWCRKGSCKGNKQCIITPTSILGIETTFKMAHLSIDFPVTGWTEE